MGISFPQHCADGHRAVSLIFTAVIISIVMNLLGGLLDGIFSLPVLSLINRTGGAVLGAVQGIFVVWIIFFDYYAVLGFGLGERSGYDAAGKSIDRNAV